jgi:CheY-like chemotaxis protein
MNHDPPLVLIAGVSPHERRIVESSLKKTGFTTVAVDDAEDAATELAANGTSCLLVIDSGLLEATHDSQWRVLRARHPGLGAVVRCLIPRAKGSLRTDGKTFLVHPDDDEGMRQAVRVLAMAPSNRAD